MCVTKLISIRSSLGLMGLILKAVFPNVVKRPLNGDLEICISI